MHRLTTLIGAGLVGLAIGAPLATAACGDGEGWAMRDSPSISYKADTPQYRSSTPVYPGMHFHSPTGNLSCYAWKSGSALSCSDLSTGANADLHSTGRATSGTGVRSSSGYYLTYGHTIRVASGIRCSVDAARGHVLHQRLRPRLPARSGGPVGLLGRGGYEDCAPAI